ncbi:tripartite motif-containing protein 3-like isoform X2 [Dysidea avara]|uniref:tripartite motif-containing protein 3-like isoform X2 n=1 Tax=Dysidea avara TaxID=196820 RepID=UPI003319BB67
MVDHCRNTSSVSFSSLLPVVLRDYSKMTENDCDQLFTQYRGKEFGNLHDVTIGPNGEIAISDGGNNCVIVLDSNLHLLSVIGRGSDGNRLVLPVGVAFSKNGNIAVCDQNSHQIKKYYLHGKLLSVISSGYGSDLGELKYPRGLVFCDNGMLYVVDQGNHRIQVFQQDDIPAFTFRSEGSDAGQFQKPVRIAIDTNRVIVSDYDGNHISLFSHTGSFITRIACDSPWAIAVSPDGFMIVSCGGEDNKIRVFDTTHRFISLVRKDHNHMNLIKFVAWL